MSIPKLHSDPHQAPVMDEAETKIKLFAAMDHRYVKESAVEAIVSYFADYDKINLVEHVFATLKEDRYVTDDIGIEDDRDWSAVEALVGRITDVLLDTSDTIELITEQI